MCVALRRFLLLALVLSACSSSGSPTSPLPDDAECRALTGEPLVPPPLADDVRAEREANLERAREALRARPDDADALVWVGRRLGYLGRFREASRVFELGLERHPDDPRFPRHLGHRSISLRAFDRAEALLERAARLAQGRPDEIEPAGLPGSGVEIDWLQHSIWYHLALARFLQADWDGAERAFRRTLALSRNDDARCSAAHWLYASLRRQGDDEEARRLVSGFTADMDVLEYHAYHRLTLLYRGELGADEVLAVAREAGGVEFASTANGVAEWHRAEGRPREALDLWREIARGSQWSAFGHIAAEAELARAARE